MARESPSAPLPASAVRLEALMKERLVSVNRLAKDVAGGQRTTVQRWLRGTTISEPYRVKLGGYFNVDPSVFKPADPLEDVTPLLERVEQIRRARGMRVGTIVGVVRRLAER